MMRITPLLRSHLYALSILLCSQAVHADEVKVTEPNGYLNIYNKDMSLYSDVGAVDFGRQWNGFEWKFNPHWESLSSSFRNLTGSNSLTSSAGTTSTTQSTGTGTSTASGSGTSYTTSNVSGSSGSGGAGCWVWVDEDWQPSRGQTASVSIGGKPTQVIDAMPAERTTPFNKVIDPNQPNGNQVVIQRVSIDYASLCPGAGHYVGAPVKEFDAIRRQNELYLGDSDRYSFSNRSFLDKTKVSEVKPKPASQVYAGLATGKLSLDIQENVKGYRWFDKSGDWIAYNLMGQVVSWGDKNNNKVWLIRDDKGIVRGVTDNTGQVLYSLHYQAQDTLLKEIRDYPRAGLTDSAPRSTKYTYDGRNRLTKVTDVRGKETIYTYDDVNRIVAITDANNNKQQIKYAGKYGQIVKQRIAADEGITDYQFEYDTSSKEFYSRKAGPKVDDSRMVNVRYHNRSGKLVRESLNGRSEKSIRYDTGNREELITNARGYVTKVTKNEFENVVGIRHPDGSTQKFSYSARHLQRIKEVDEAGVVTLYTRDDKGNLLERVQAAGTPEARTTLYQRNSKGQVTQVTYKGRTEANGVVTPDAVWKMSYNAFGDIETVTDPFEHSQTYKYNRLGKLISYTDEKEHTTSYSYDAAGNLTSITDPLLQTTVYTYDDVGNTVKVKDARGYETTYAYDSMNRNTTTEHAEEGTSRIDYDVRGLPVREVDADGRISEVSFDNFLRVTTQKDGNGNVTRNEYRIADGTDKGSLASLYQPAQVNYPTFKVRQRYDARERPTTESMIYSNAEGQQQASQNKVYDKRGLLIRQTDAKGKEIVYEYDGLRQLIKQTDRLGNSTEFRYDARGNVITVIDSNKGEYQFTYDTLNRVTQETLPLGQTTAYRYDELGNLIGKTMANGDVYAYSYDEISQLKTIKTSRGEQKLLEVSFSYDPNQNLSTWTHKDLINNTISRTKNEYDKLNRLIKETVTYDGGYQLSYAYDYSKAGKKTAITLADGTKVVYKYSDHGELKQAIIPNEGEWSVDSYNWVKPASISLPGQNKKTLSYDGLLQLTSTVTQDAQQQPVLSLEQTYDIRGILTSKDRKDTANQVELSKYRSYVHDEEHRLTEIKNKDGELVTKYKYDALANRIKTNKGSSNWIYDANNRLKQRGADDEQINYSYDDNGNLTQKTTANSNIRYHYDSLNRLIRVTEDKKGVIARYSYDPLNRRLTKEVYQGNTGVRTYYLYAQEGLIAEATQALTITDNKVTAKGTPEIHTQYGVRPDGMYGTDLLFIKTKDSNQQTVYAYYENDHLGTPIQAINKAGNIVWAAQYDAFGEAKIVTPKATTEKPTITSNVRLPGQYYDVETQLHYNWNRYYDYSTGKYITQDPIGLEGGINIYGYVDGSPLYKIDTEGKFAVGPAARIVLAALAGLCARHPKICKEVGKCVINPNKCLKRLCKLKSDNLYHPVCDVPGCDKMTSPIGRDYAKKAATACVALRKFVKNACFKGKADKDHQDQIDKAEAKLQKCRDMCMLE